MANGGIRTHPDSGRVAVAMQYEGAKQDRMPLVGLFSTEPGAAPAS